MQCTSLTCTYSPDADNVATVTMPARKELSELVWKWGYELFKADTRFSNVEAEMVSYAYSAPCLTIMCGVSGLQVSYARELNEKECMVFYEAVYGA